MKFIGLAVVVSCAVLANSKDSDGFGYEIIMNVLDMMRSNSSTLATKVDQLMDDQQKHSKNIAQDHRSVVMKVDHLTEIFVNHTKTVATKLDQLIDLVAAGDPGRCPENATDGVYNLNPVHSSIPAFSVFCENGWIMIHRRFNGSVDFNRKWVSYREGFGDLQGEHWLGLEKVHQLTRVGSYKLKVVLKSFADVEKTMNYEGFRIGSENEQYQLNLGRFVKGDLGNCFGHHNKMKFSTPDRDNDIYSGSCAGMYKSGWWFHDCYYTNLNGLYGKGKNVSTMSWSSFMLFECLKEARMMIRAVKSSH